MMLQFTSYNTKLETNRIFRRQLHPLRMNLGSKQKFRCNQKEIPYIFTVSEFFEFPGSGCSLVSVLLIPPPYLYAGVTEKPETSIYLEYFANGTKPLNVTFLYFLVHKIFNSKFCYFDTDRSSKIRRTSRSSRNLNFGRKVVFGIQ